MPPNPASTIVNRTPANLTACLITRSTKIPVIFAPQIWMAPWSSNRWRSSPTHLEAVSLRRHSSQCAKSITKEQKWIGKKCFSISSITPCRIQCFQFLRFDVGFFAPHSSSKRRPWTINGIRAALATVARLHIDMSARLNPLNISLNQFVSLVH